MTFQAIKTAVKKFIEDEEGLTAVEYSIAGGLVSAGLVLAFTNLGTRAKALMNALLLAMGAPVVP